MSPAPTFGKRIPTMAELRTVGQRIPDRPGVPPRLRLDHKPPDTDRPAELLSEAVVRQYADPLRLPASVSRLKVRAGVMATYGPVRVPLEMVQDYQEARKYLASGPSGRRLLATLENRDVPIQLVRGELDAQARAFSGTRDYLEVEVTWDPRAAMVASAGGRLPPAEVLAHEFSHAIRFGQDEHGRYLPNPEGLAPVPSSTNAFERNVIRGPEAEITLEHGNDAPRDDHFGVVYKTKGVGSTQALYPEDEAAIAVFTPLLKAATRHIDQRAIDPELVPTHLVNAAFADALAPGRLAPSPAAWSDAQMVAVRHVLREALDMRLKANATARANAASPATLP